MSDRSNHVNWRIPPAPKGAVKRKLAPEQRNNQKKFLIKVKKHRDVLPKHALQSPDSIMASKKIGRRRGNGKRGKLNSGLTKMPIRRQYDDRELTL